MPSTWRFGSQSSIPSSQAVRPWLAAWIGITILLSVLVMAPSPARAGELAGVDLAESLSVGDTTLVLNGLGLRKKVVFKVYVAGLYLVEKSTDGPAILAADQPRALVMEFLRKVDGEAIAGGWTECLANNSPDAAPDVRSGFTQLNGWMTKVRKRDRMSFVYQPGVGTEVRVGDEVRGSIAGKPFADALFACWVGAVPPSADFKRGLLGG